MNVHKLAHRKHSLNNYRGFSLTCSAAPAQCSEDTIVALSLNGPTPGRVLIPQTRRQDS